MLARLLWEKDVSKVFTHLGLAENVAARSYTATGQINKFATKDKAMEISEIRQATGIPRMVEDGMYAN